MSLPDAWVERIFDKLTLVYGHQFLSRWDGLKLSDVKADWGRELRGFAQSAKAIAYGLENLPPSKPPTVLEFRAICSSPHAPRPELHLAITHRSKTPQDLVVDRHIERIKRVNLEHPEYGGAGWAFALEGKDQEEPERVSYAARTMYREVATTWRGLHGRASTPHDEDLPWQ